MLRKTSRYNPSDPFHEVWLEIEKHQFKNGLSLLSKVNTRDRNDDWFHAHARCLSELKYYEAALRSLAKIKDKNKKKFLLSKARCYQAIGQYDLALESFYKIRDGQNDKKVLIGIAHCYEEMGWHSKAWDVYNELINKFPFYRRAIHHICRYAIEQKHPDALTILNNFINGFYRLSGLYVLKAQYYFQQQNEQVAFQILKDTIEKFPYCHNAYLTLICHYLYTNQIRKAKVCQQHCIQLFKDNPILLMRIQKLMDAAAFIQQWGYDYSVDKHESIKVILPSPIKSALALLSDTSCEPYLVGSSVHSLLNKLPLRPNHDIDLVIKLENKTELNTKVFSPSFDNPHLYHANIDGFLIDCYVMSRSAHKRDFTIACLFCDQNGIILDPTGMGLRDFKNKILRTVGNSTSCFQEDPVRLLRAINYIVSGYIPTPDVNSAMMTWHPDGDLDIPHLQAVARKHLLHLSPADQINYCQKLQNYGLLQKIFGITPSTNIETTLLQLQDTLRIKRVHGKHANHLKFFQQMRVNEDYILTHPSLFHRYVDIHAQGKTPLNDFEALDLAERRLERKLR